MAAEHTSYAPSVVWRLCHSDGRAARSIVVPRGQDASALWFINEQVEGAHDFESRDAAVKWLEDVRKELETKGWKTLNESFQESEE